MSDLTSTSDTPAATERTWLTHEERAQQQAEQRRIYALVQDFIQGLGLDPAKTAEVEIRAGSIRALTAGPLERHSTGSDFALRVHQFTYYDQVRHLTYEAPTPE